MNRQMKYLRRIDTGVVIEVDPALLEILKAFFDQAGIQYEILDTPPGSDEEKPKRRRSS
jgi:hypothetical protein